jgi:hypothetical protein
MTDIQLRIGEFWIFLKMHWFIVLCISGFCAIVAISAQGFDTFILGILVFFLWIIGPSMILLVWFAARYQEKRKTRLKPVNLAAFAMCCSLSWSVVFTDWPLRLNFLLSRPALVREAQNLVARKPASSGHWVGGFYVQKSAVERGVICFWTDGDSNRTGIIFNPKGGTPPFNLWSELPLGGNWHVITED